MARGGVITSREASLAAENRRNAGTRTELHRADTFLRGSMTRRNPRASPWQASRQRRKCRAALRTHCCARDE